MLKTLNIRETGAVILTSGLDDIFISHYDVQEIVDLGILPAKIGIGAAIPPSIIRGALWLENALEPFGFRYWIRRSPIAGLANLNTYHETTALLRSIPQVTIAAIVSVTRASKAKTYWLTFSFCRMAEPLEEDASLL